MEGKNRHGDPTAHLLSLSASSRGWGHTTEHSPRHMGRDNGEQSHAGRHETFRGPLHDYYHYPPCHTAAQAATAHAHACTGKRQHGATMEKKWEVKKKWTAPDPPSAALLSLSTLTLTMTLHDMGTAVSALLLSLSSPSHATALHCTHRCRRRRVPLPLSGYAVPVTVTSVTAMLLPLSFHVASMR